MNKKMTFLAFGAKWGFLGAKGSSPADAPAPTPNRSARAIAPSLTPHCFRNQRRAAHWAMEEERTDKRIGSLLGNGLVKVQKQPCQRRPRCRLSRLYFLRQ